MSEQSELDLALDRIQECISKWKTITTDYADYPYAPEVRGKDLELLLEKLGRSSNQFIIGQAKPLELG